MNNLNQNSNKVFIPIGIPVNYFYNQNNNNNNPKTNNNTNNNSTNNIPNNKQKRLFFIFHWFWYSNINYYFNSNFYIKYLTISTNYANIILAKWRVW